MHKCVAVCALTIMIWAGGFSRAQSLGPVIPTTVCDLSENPERYSKFPTIVRVRAFVVSDLKHVTNLDDANCNKVGVSLDSDDWDDRPVALLKDKNYEQFHALYPHIIELRNKGQRIYGTFEGLFEWHPENAPRGPLRMLILRQVTDLHVGEQDDPKYALQDK